MRIVIEDYYGNDIISLGFKQSIQTIDQISMDETEAIANEYGYNVADIEEDSDGEFIRVQEVNVDNSDDEARRDLFLLIQDLIKEFL